MRILNLLVSSKEGGAETFFMRFGPAMAKQGTDQLMVMSANSRREAWFEEHATPYVRIDFDRARGLWGRWKLRQVIRKFEPDIIIAWLKIAPRLLPRRCRALKVGRVGGYYKIKHYKHCDYIVANSLPLKNFIKRQGFSNTVCISNFVTIGSRAPSISPKRRPLLFFHGRLHPQKGLDVLIDAMEHIDADAQIAGAGPLEEELRQQATSNGVGDRIQFLGWQEDAWPHLAQADLYVFPSRYEGTSNSLLEAMACGKPIITTSSESVSWFLTHEENALIVDVDDARQLAHAINRLIAEPELACRLGENARNLYQERFSEDAICAQWLSFLEHALGGSSTLTSVSQPRN